MDQPTKTITGFTSASESASAPEQLKTVLLSNRPDTAAITATPPALANPNLTTGSLAALSQRYDILGEAGHGNMGNVYKARDRETGETVALKLIKTEIASDQGMMERFKNELLFARKITHKNVCRVYDFNRIGGIAYTSMEYVEGESLRSVLNRFGGLPVRKGIDLALQICSGLKEAHAQGIVHRDLKPENVMIDAQGNLKLMDFGIARSMEAGTRLTGAMIGTPAYMAPEQVAGKPVDYRTDIYSLGLMLYEMFTGSQTFRADTPVAVALKQMREAPVAPHDVDPTIPVFIERAILKCLEKDPAKRYQSAAELESALRAQTGTGVRTAGAAIVSAMRSSDATVAVDGTALSAERTAQKSRRTSPVVWVLVGAFAVLAMLAGAHEMSVAKSAKQTSPPAQLSAPIPPASAFQIPVMPRAAAKPAQTPASVKAKAAAPKILPLRPRFAPRQQGFGQLRRGFGQGRQGFAQQQQGFGQPRQGIAQANLGANARVYLWVGRFGKEQRAQNIAQRLENKGLPVVVLPRQSPTGKFFVVFTGPFPKKRAQNIKRWLEAQGVFNAHEVKPPGGN